MKYIKKPKIILVPYPAQGHVTPMLKLASAINNLGLHFQPVLVTPEYIHNQIVQRIEAKDGILCVAIPGGMELKDSTSDFFAIEAAMENTMPNHLESLVHKFEGDEDGGVVCIVADLLASWAIEVAKSCGIPAAGFWPAMFATYRLFAAIPDMLRSGLISDTGIPEHQGKVQFLPDTPLLFTEDLPWLIGSLAARQGRFEFWRRAMDRTKSLRCLLVNSFPDEYYEQQIIDMLVITNIKVSQDCSLVVLPIGPLCKHSNAMTKNPSFWEEDFSCLNWLDKQKANSVVYIAFGSSISPIGDTKLKNVALALEASTRPFIWVLRSAWLEGLPIGFLEKVSKQGKVVSWAPQMEVLQHKAVGCYLTHCGWNSTMEAIQCRKRLLCYPAVADQFMNCAYIVQVWRIGLMLNELGQKDVEEGLSRVMEDKEMESRLMKLYERTMGEEANSRVVSNLTAFVDEVKKVKTEYSCYTN
ncbi:Glycosyltransferase [Quillaja saponaria]|uniref:Glycosyltransferase n=1 Tax=Quillaja saponaria TaxID=32244 RepID=A0AAD7LUM3_QUISA|nr:Glycosyltransferase [Quillaja saponaria]